MHRSLEATCARIDLVISRGDCSALRAPRRDLLQLLGSFYSVVTDVIELINIYDLRTVNALYIGIVPVKAV